MKGYWKNPQATDDAFVDGFFRTGDVAIMDEEGFFFIVDRIKDLIICSGYNVYPRQVDEVLFHHPRVAEAACVGRLDPRLGEVLVAFVVRVQGQELEPDDLQRHCRENLVKYRRPVAFYFLEGLPRTAAKKIDRKDLRARAASLAMERVPANPST